ncbi:MAG: DUF1893 domain-containing protein [Clostridia bacterium]|nr:DUF1893 domain-containing protein [Clostridia bacterium]
MTKNLLSAKATLEEQNLTCCLTDGVNVIKSCERGVKPLLQLLDSGTDVSGFSAADKVVGKAAAFLYVLLGVSEVYAFVISQKAADVFEKHGITVYFESCVPAIINRAGDGLCPMETAVGEISDAHIALCAIKEKLAQLSASK